MNYQKEVNEDLLHFFGYVADERPDNNTPYFDFKGKGKPQNVAQTNGFKKLNQKGIEMRQA